MRFHAYRKLSHTHVIGGTRSGKSKFLEYLIRQDIKQCRPFALIDWHGTLYKAIVAYLTYLDPQAVKFRLLDPTQSDFVSGFNPFGKATKDISALASRRVQAVIRPFGLTNTNEMPTFERIARMLFTFVLETGEPLQNAVRLLRFDERDLREWAIRNTRDPFMRMEWTGLQRLNARDWQNFVLSTENRLSRFLSSESIRRTIGQPSGISIPHILKFGHCLLVNLGFSDSLDRQSAAVFASLLLTEFFEAAMRRAGTKEMYTLYLDEFQEYATPDFASILDQVLKGGLHLVMAHQHLAQVKDDWLKDSVLTNARSRIVFGGGSFHSASELAQDLLLSDINSRDVKVTNKSPYHEYQLEKFTTDTWGDGDAESEGEGPMGPTENKTHSGNRGGAAGTRYAPQLQWNEIEVEWSRDEKVSRAAERLMRQEQRHCLVRLDGEETVAWEVPVLTDYSLPPRYSVRWKGTRYKKQGAVTGEEADRLLAESEQQFLVKAKEEMPEVFTSKTSKPTRRK